MKHSYVIPLRFSPLSYILARGRAVWKLAWLITKRSRVQIPLPQLKTHTANFLFGKNLAQLVEHMADNYNVVGSNPTILSFCVL